MAKVDVNGDGIISYDELMMSYVHRKVNAKEERMWQVRTTHRIKTNC
jgi:hypothetical protein